MVEYIYAPGTEDLSKYGLSKATVTNRYVFTAGMALDLETMSRKAAADTIANETRICLQSIKDTLEITGCSMRDIVKTNCYLSSNDYRREFWDAYNEFLAPGPYPHRCTFVVGIARDCRVEIDVIALRPEARG